MNSLVSAIQAVKEKIAASASTATPEELAYLGTALDRIGGRATVYEVVAVGDEKMAQLAAVAEDLRSAMEAETSTQLTEFVSKIDKSIAEITLATEARLGMSLKTIEEAKEALELHIAAKVSQASKAASVAAEDVKSAAAELSSVAAIAHQQALNSSMFVNHYFASIR